MNSTHLRNLLLAAICLFAGVTAKAQFSGSADQYPTTDYSSSPIAFKLSEIATALGTDATTLGTVLSTYIEAETPEALFFLPDAEGNETSAPSADANGFWMSATGQRLNYGDGCYFYASPSVDAEADEFAFYVGQMPGVMQVGDVANATITLKYNEKAVTFALTLNVIAKPEFNVPEPTVIESQLQIVGSQEVVVEQYPRGGYDSDPVKVNVAEALSLLNITEKAALAENLAVVLYATQYNDGDVENGGGMKKDSLTNTSTAGAPGWWVRPVQDSEGQLTGECSAAGWGDTDRFFVEAFSYNAETDTLQCNLGQYPGTCKDNEQYFTNIYIVYGEKAYLIKYTLKILEKEQGNGLADYTKVGEQAYEVTQEPTNDYSTKQVTIDVETIATALGCEVSALGVYMLDDKDNFGGSTANNGGWWLTNTGTITSWGAGAAFFIEPATANDWSVVNVGQYPDVLKVDDEVSATLNFVNGTNYYPVTITLKITEPQKQEFDFESVETRSFAVQSVPDASYTALDLITISPESIEALIGTTAPTLYGLNNDSIAAIKGIYSNAYSCDPKPGFWLAKDGTVSTWGANSPVGICWVDNTTLRFFQYPNANAVGDVFKTTLFLVNEETGKMLTLNISLSIVESLEEKEVVGEENIVIPFAQDEIDTEIDLSKAAEALGVTASDLLDSNNYYLRGMAAGAYAAGVNCENGLSFKTDGDFDGYGNLYVYFQTDGDKVYMSSGSNDPVADDFNVKAQFCFEVEGKQYVYYATLASKAWADGIETVAADSHKAAAIYDLQGRQVVNAQRGLYIQNGRKFIVK